MPAGSITVQSMTDFLLLQSIRYQKIIEEISLIQQVQQSRIRSVSC